MFKAKSTTKKAKQIIRTEIFAFYTTKDTTYDAAQEYEIIAAIKNMKADADAYNNDQEPSTWLTNWIKGAGLVDAGCFRCYFYDIANFLVQIYGASVYSWSLDKAHKTYRNLIGREYAQLVEKYKID